MNDIQYSALLQELLQEARKIGKNSQNPLTAERFMVALIDAVQESTETLPELELSREMLTILRNQRLNGKMPFYLHSRGIPVAHKTGEDDGLSNDVGIVYAREPFVVCFAGHDTDVYRWEDLMRRGTYDLVQAQTEE